MKSAKADVDQRIKRKSFSWSRFIIVFSILIMLAIGQSLIVTNYYDSSIIPPELLNPLILYWAVVAATFSLFTTISIRRRYERPMKRMSKVTKQVAEGDFSGRMEVLHNPDKLDYLDVMLMDFNTMVEELGSIEILKNDFISSVSHEIKTPVAVIQNYVTLLQDESLTSEKRREYSDIIFHASDQLTELVSNILRLSKLDNQAIVPTPQPYDICRQLSDCVMSFADRLEEKELEFTADIEDKAFVLADESMMEIIWNNLLSNAIKFTDLRGKITMTQFTKDDGIWVCIADTGCGMDEQTIRHIFDKFYQGDTSHSQEGYGLGLALVARIIDLNNGEITVTSSPGKGSAFTVHLQQS